MFGVKSVIILETSQQHLVFLQFGVMNTSLQLKMTGFKISFNKGIVKLLELYVENNLMFFDKLKVKYDIAQQRFFKYLQLRSFILTSLKNSVHQPFLSTLETFSTQVTQLYNILVENHEDNSESKRLEWIQDFT